MPNDPLFPGQYRGSGQVTLLCEGDAIGYDAQFLGMWTREFEPGSRQVDVLACGTGEGLLYSPNKPLGELMVGDQLLDFLDSRLGEWNGIKRSDQVWRIDWGGKEVLKFVRQQLSARADGWWSIEKGKPVAWDKIGSRAKQDDHDRKIERELQRHLVKRLLEHVLSDAGTPMRAELDQLTAMLRS